MSPTLFPFLYRTRTIQQACRLPQRFTFTPTARHAHGRRVPRDSNVPFDFESSPPADDQPETQQQQAQSTITPQEAAIFKDIFDEIANGEMPMPKGPPSGEKGALWTMPNKKARPAHHQERMRTFREQFLQRYPSSLRRSAQAALGTIDAGEEVTEEERAVFDEDRTQQLLEKSMYENARKAEWSRVTALMDAADTDLKLWNLLKREVFKIPGRLALADAPEASTAADPEAKKPKKNTKKQQQQQSEEVVTPTESPEATSRQKRMEMNVQGLLYPQYLVYAMNRLDSAFDFPSQYIFQVLPHLRSLGMPAYILGVSTPLYTTLAGVHWRRFADAGAALDTLQEINAMGLSADKEVVGFLREMREDMHKCTWGGRGEVVMQVMEGAGVKYDVDGRLEWLLQWARESTGEVVEELAEEA